MYELLRGASGNSWLVQARETRVTKWLLVLVLTLIGWEHGMIFLL